MKTVSLDPRPGLFSSFMVAVTVLPPLVFNLKFACVVPRWDGLVQSNYVMAGPPASLSLAEGPRNEIKLKFVGAKRPTPTQ